MEKLLLIVLLLSLMSLGHSLIEIFTAGPTSVPRPPGKYRTGRMSFQKDKLSNNATFERLQARQPMFVLSISHLEYNGYIGLRLNRSLEPNGPNSMLLVVNASMIYQTEPIRIFLMQVTFLVSEPIVNIETAVLNVSYSHPVQNFTTKFPYGDNLRCVYFAVGFTSNIFTIAVVLKMPDISSRNFTLYFVDLELIGPREWVELILVTVNYSPSAGCSRGSMYYKQLLINDSSRPIYAYRDNIQYVVGLATIDSGGGYFHHNEDAHTVESRTNISYFRYSLIGMNMTCIVGATATAKPQSPNLNPENWSARLSSLPFLMLVLIGLANSFPIMH